MNKLMIAAATFAACAAAEAADFQIGAYCLKENARTEQHIKGIAPHKVRKLCYTLHGSSEGVETICHQSSTMRR